MWQLCQSVAWAGIVLEGWRVSFLRVGRVGNIGHDAGNSWRLSECILVVCVHCSCQAGLYIVSFLCESSCMTPVQKPVVHG